MTYTFYVRGKNKMKTKNKMYAPTPEIKNELYLYHCAEGYTRASMAKGNLVRAGFRFKKGCIFWPDGAMLTYKDGNIDYRTEVR